MSSNTYTGLATGSLHVQKYNSFKGVDFSDETTNENRSPDSLNMWIDYSKLGKCVETRPDLDVINTLTNTIYGLFFYTINNIDHQIIHTGTKLIDYNPKTKEITTLVPTGMNPNNSIAFIYQNIFFLLDGLHYYEYNGQTIKEVVGTIPTTTIGMKPSGAGTSHLNVNLLSDYRKNSFWGDGTTKEYHLDSKNIDEVSSVWITNADTGVDVLQDTSKYSIDLVNGVITFTEAPYKPSSADNVKVQFKKIVNGYRDKINKCTMVSMFDNHIFYSGNIDLPNTIYFSALNDPRYIPDINYIIDGTTIAKIKGMAVGNNALWTFKESSQEDTTIFYHQPVETVDTSTDASVKAYPTTNSTISTGCIATGINFNDDIVFFSNRGMEGIQNNINTETILGHRSSLVDRKMLSEDNYKNMRLIEWNGYLLVIIGNKVYLADSRQKTTNINHVEYEWFYWEFDKNINCASVHDDVLYLGSEEYQITDSNGYLKYSDGTNIYYYDSTNKVLYDSSYAVSSVLVSTLTKVVESKIYSLTNKSDSRNILSYWSTSKDDYGYNQMMKTTNKKGFKTDINGTVTIYVKTDNGEYESLGNYTSTKGYIVTKIKRKKWNKIQLMYKSNTPFAIYDITLESYIGGYVKRS